ncbi:hypothetical protein [Aquisalimonas sp.]|nr:hypothetical protein [Aquisalimonas sp.]
MGDIGQERVLDHFAVLDFEVAKLEAFRVGSGCAGEQEYGHGDRRWA